MSALRLRSKRILSFSVIISLPRVTTLSYAQRNERTISSTALVEGYGYWSGRNVRVEFRPAPPGTGIVFVRSDLNPVVRIPANVAHRIEVPRRTVLRHGRAPASK